MFKNLEVKLGSLLPLLIALTLFWAPINSSLKSIFLIASLLTLIANPFYRQLSWYTWTSAWGIAAVALFLLVILASIWSPASFSIQLSVIEKYWKLLVLPILAVGFIDKRIRNWSLNAYLAAIVITCVLSILKAKFGLVWHKSADQGEVFFNHIATGFMVSFAAYLAGYLAQLSQGRARLIYLLIWFISSYQIVFINTGRTGYITYFVLMILLLMQHLSLRQATLSVILFCTVLVYCYLQTPLMNSQINSLIHETKLVFQNQKSTSIGFRLDFHEYAQKLWFEHPIMGVGTGGFKYSFYQDNPVPEWGRNINEPHSQYWFTLAEQGLLGFSLLLALLCSLLYIAIRAKNHGSILLGFLVVFAITCASDTILCFSPLGYLLMLFGALCGGELLEAKYVNRITLR